MLGFGRVWVLYSGFPYPTAANCNYFLGHLKYRLFNLYAIVPSTLFGLFYSV